MSVITLLKPFKEIAEPDKCYRLEWFGGVYANHDDPSNPLIECFFTPFVPGKPDAKGLPVIKRDFAGQIRAGLAVGYLPTLYLGQTFRGGKRKASLGRPDKVIRLRLNLQSADAVEESSLDSAKEEHRFDPVFGSFLKHGKGRGSSPLAAGLKALRGDVLQKGSIPSDEPKPVQIFIPELELIRFYYAPTELMAKLIFRGEFCNSGWSGRICNMLHEGPTYDLESGIARFVYRIGFSKADEYSHEYRHTFASQS